MIEIEFYETEDGKCPLEEYLDSLEPKLELALAKKYKDDYERRHQNG